MIRFENVSKSYWTGKRRKIILEQSSFTIPLGLSLGIFAKNGTGKTTVINMMAGLELPDSGRIVRDCKVSFPLGPIGGMSPKLSTAENIRIIARMHGLDADPVEAMCRYIADIDEYFDRPMRQYSTGMGARARYAMLLSLDYDIYLIDESLPTTTDVEFNRRAADILSEKLRSATVVIVSHEETLVRQFCQQAAVLHDGDLKFFDSIDEARALYDWTA